MGLDSYFQSPPAVEAFNDLRAKKSSKPKPQATFTLPLEYKSDVEDAVDTWFKAYKSKHNDKTERQRKRMRLIMEALV